MTNNFDAEAAKKIIYDDNVNITEANPIKDIGSIFINIVLFLVAVYLFVFIGSGIALNNLSPEKQIVLENFISPKVQPKIAELSGFERNRLNKIKHNILSVDKNFPKTSNLKIELIDSKQLNALCYPNGNIYITSALYKELKKDDELTFVIAHEMGHYKHKDHLMNLRRGLANSAVLLILSVANPNNQDINKIAEGSLNITELKFSRGVEANADRYAVKVMNALYGTSKAGVDVMNILKEKNKFDIEFLSSHPNLDNRINYINKFSK